jgi:hypothetical protein
MPANPDETHCPVAAYLPLPSGGEGRGEGGNHPSPDPDPDIESREKISHGPGSTSVYPFLSAFDPLTLPGFCAILGSRAGW